MTTPSSASGERDLGPTEPPLAPGEVLAPNYEVVAHLRRGNRLDVYDAWSVERSCRCVAKTLRPERAIDGRGAERLRIEGRLLGELSHPHLVRCYELTETVGRPRPVVILETLPGHTVGYLIEHHGTLSAYDVAHLGLQLCSVLSYLHRAGWVHLDVKPSNVIASGGRAVLLDLSVAELIGTTDAGGTFDYLSPEQARGDAVSPAADVWGLGVMLWECLTGAPPFEAWDHDRGPEGGRTYPQTTERVPSLVRRKGVSHDLGKIVDACLEPMPGARPSLDEVSSHLAAFAGIDPRTAGAAVE